MWERLTYFLRQPYNFSNSCRTATIHLGDNLFSYFLYRICNNKTISCQLSDQEPRCQVRLVYTKIPNHNKPFRISEQMPIRFRLYLYIAFSLFWFFCGCGNEDLPNESNYAPKISLLKAETDIVEPGQQVSIYLKTIDLEGDPISYSWQANGGSIQGDENGAVWLAPENERKYTIEITVSDGFKSNTSSIDLQVWKTRLGNYYPLSVGNTWHYEDDQGNQIVFEIIDTIQIQLPDNRTEKSYVLQKYDPNLPEEERVYNFSYLGKEIDENGEVKAIIQQAQNVTSGTDGTIMFVPFLPLYKFPLIPGYQWQKQFQAKLTPELFPIGGGLDKNEVLSEETLNVPAGQFENVFQVQETFKWRFFDRDLDETVVQKWLAPDVGIIKFTQAQTRADVTVEVDFELVSYDLVNGNELESN